MPSFQEVYKILADLKVLNQVVANTITKYGQHVSMNEKLKSIANLYLENTTKTLNFFENLLYTDEFATHELYVSVYQDHVILLGKIRELEKKYKHAKIKRIMMFGFGAVIFIPCLVVAVVGQLNPAFGWAGQGGEMGVEVMKKFFELMEKDNSMETLLGLSRLIGNRTKGNIEAMKKIMSGHP